MKSKTLAIRGVLDLEHYLIESPGFKRPSTGCYQ